MARVLVAVLLGFLLLPTPGRAQTDSLTVLPIRVEVSSTIRRLIDEEDTDGDKKITIDDRFIGGGR
ncbi:MAG: trehalase calcium-binding domain-containing protein [Gemmatimonadales bacterium]|jgi:hypothetical protein